MKLSLIASCGMNCSLCLGYQREKNRCPGCRIIGESQSEYRQKCILRNCLVLKENKLKYCSSRCPNYPCKRLKSLDKRYRTKYGMSMIENLEFIHNNGIRKFISSEEKRWACSKCGNVICVHRNFCLSCGKKRRVVVK
jgi:hypothetical protein